MWSAGNYNLIAPGKKTATLNLSFCCCAKILSGRMINQGVCTMHLALSLIFCITLAAVAPAATTGRVQLEKRSNQKPSKGALDHISTRAEFDRLARIYYRGRFYALP